MSLKARSRTTPESMLWNFEENGKPGACLRSASTYSVLANTPRSTQHLGVNQCFGSAGFLRSRIQKKISTRNQIQIIENVNDLLEI
jgi:hypothetical protein